MTDAGQRRPRPTAVVVVAVLCAIVAAAALFFWPGVDESLPAPPPERTAPGEEFDELDDVGVDRSEADVPPDEAIALPLGSDLQQIVDAHPPGTTYVLEAGLHRLAHIVPKDGDVYLGEEGAVLSGARELEGWWEEDGLWVVDGQDQQGRTHGTVLEGREADRHPENLWLDDVLLTQQLSRDGLGEDEWHLDYEADRIYLAIDPSGRDVETSVTSHAFTGPGVSDVMLRDLIVERYANQAQIGAIDGSDTGRWSIDRVEVRENHGPGIGIGPGMTITRSRIVANGQIGIAGDGRTDGAPGECLSPDVVVRGNEIAGNRTLGFDWGWEGGATKFKYVCNMLFEHNWVHRNHGPGPWWDIDNRDVVVRANLVEHNDQAGIFYEISFGHADIYGNIVRGNGREASGHEGAGIDISSSSNITVRHNAIDGNRQGILVRQDDRSWDTQNVEVHSNDIRMTTGFTGFSDARFDLSYYTSRGNRFYNNTYRIDQEPARGRFFVDSARRDATHWQRAGQDEEGTFLDVSEAPVVPPDVTTFQRTGYGPWQDVS